MPTIVTSCAYTLFYGAVSVVSHYHLHDISRVLGMAAFIVYSCLALWGGGTMIPTKLSVIHACPCPRDRGSAPAACNLPFPNLTNMPATAWQQHLLTLLALLIAYVFMCACSCLLSCQVCFIYATLPCYSRIHSMEWDRMEDVSPAWCGSLLPTCPTGSSPACHTQLFL